MPFRKTLSNAQSAQPAVGRGTTAQTGWAKYFGPSKHGDPPMYDEKDRATWTLPEGYTLAGGRNEYLATTFEELAFFADSWYTQVALPITRTDKTGVQWERFEFDGTLTDIVPHRGVTRIVQSSRTEGSATFDRRGLGFRLEHGFMNTELGRQHYRANIAQINRAVEETNNFGVLHALLTCDDYNAEWERENGWYNGKEVKDVLENDVFLWDILKQTKNGMFILDTWVTGRMNRYKGEADMWIVTPEITQYITQVPKENTDYWLAGARGPSTLVDGVDSFTNFGRGLRIYVTRTYDVDKDGPVDPMSSPRQIGEYYAALDTNKGGDYNGYRSIWRSIQIYDEDNDKFETLDLNFLLENSRRHDENGKLRNINAINRFTAKFSAEDVNADFLHYVDQEGDLQVADYMGQTRINVDDVLDVGRSILTTLPLSVKDGASLHKVFYDGVRAINLIESLSYSDDKVKAYLNAVADALELDDLPSDPSLLETVNIKPVKTNSFGSIDLLAGGGLPLPPGYANYPGFRTIAALSRQGDQTVTNQGFDAQWFKIVADFVDLIDDIVSKLRIYLPNAIVLNKKYASPWWTKPDAATVFFENVITKHRYPLFFKLGGAPAEEEGEGEDESMIGDDLNANNLTPPQINDLNAISSPWTTSLNELVVKYTGDTAKDDVKAFYGDGFKVANDDKFDVGVKKVARASLLSYVLSSSAIKKGDNAGNKASIDSVYDKVVAQFNNVDDVDDNLNNYAQKILDVANKNKKLFRSKALKSMGTTFQGILNEIEDLKRESVRDDKRFSLLHRRNDDGDEDFLNLPALDNFVRSPLTTTPELFRSIIADANLVDAVVLPASPNNPGRPVNGTEAAENADLLDVRSEHGDLSKVPAVIQPSSIGDELFNSTHIASAININNYNNKDELTRDVDFNEPSNIGAIYPNDEDDFYSRGHRRSDILSIHGSYGRKSTIRDTRVRKHKKRRSTMSRTVGTKLARELDFDEGLYQKVALHRFQELFSEVHEKSDDPLVRVFALAFLLTPTDLRNYKALVRYNIVIPWNFLVFRPHARYVAQTVIKMKAGTATGATYMGNSHFTLGDDAIVQEHVGTYTYYSKSVVTQPKHVYAVRNAYINGYEGGMGVHPYDIDQEYNPIRDEYGNGSIFVVAVPRHEVKFPNPLSITGEFHYFEHQIDDLRSNDTIHYSTAPYYNRLYGWQAFGISGDLDLPGLVYGNEMSRPNSIVYRGHTRRYSSVDKKFSDIEKGTGHWKPGNTYIGCARVRKGQLAEFDTKSYNTN